MNDERYELSAAQIKTIVDKLVPLIAAPEDHEFFRGVLTIKAEQSTSSSFAYFVWKLLNREDA